MTPKNMPTATYRLQFHAKFTFQDASAIVPYLNQLGISDLYASPFLKASPGSTHGYDIIDHSQLNSEIGTEQDFDKLSSDLVHRGMGILLDTVPNHMGVSGNGNPWWTDVLENGPSSPFAEYFDIAWTSGTRAELQGRVLIPILGDFYARVLEAQQLRLVLDQGAFYIHYFEHRFPVAPRSYAIILSHQLKDFEAAVAATDPGLLELQSILTALKHLPASNETDPALVAERQREKEVIKRRLATLTNENAQVREFLERNVQRFNGFVGDPKSFDLLEQLLNEQVYRLAYWRVAAEEINYRRFFDVNELAALSMERPDVFENAHSLIFKLIQEGKIRGLRIDHPDGLFDPRQYLQRLTEATSKLLPDSHSPFYVVVEKILSGDELLPSDWPTQGTTGYEFLNLVNGLFVDSANESEFNHLYANWIGDETTFSELTYQKKILILQIALAGEMQMLIHQLDRLAQMHRNSRDFTRNGLRVGLREVIASLPVYRTYISSEVSESDRRQILRAVRRATLRNPALSSSIFHFIRDTLLLRPPSTGPLDEDYMNEQKRFVGKFQQVTGPVMAKAAEDTAAYIYNRLLSLNEVGGNPDRFGVSVADFHNAMLLRKETTPYALSASATHDTKRGEDVRARINVLSEIPDEWQARLGFWRRINEQHRIQVEEHFVPDRNEEYFLYQTLFGAWPTEGSIDGEFVERIQQYMTKALHEAKVHTSWINPNLQYDEGMSQFVSAILVGKKSPEFLRDFTSFVRRYQDFGLVNSLSQCAIKITAPGIPDFYQGTELWDLNLVDPDNRRAVDFQRRQQALETDHQDLEGLIRNRTNGEIKLFLIRRTLGLRNENPRFFSEGSYASMEVVGSRSSNVVAFSRTHGDRTILTIVPRLLTGWTKPGDSPFSPLDWLDTRILLPDPRRPWRNILTNKHVNAIGDGLRMNDVLRDFPVAVLSAVSD